MPDYKYMYEDGGGKDVEKHWRLVWGGKKEKNKKNMLTKYSMSVDEYRQQEEVKGMTNEETFQTC